MKVLRKAMDFFKYPFRKFFYTYIFTNDVNKVMESLAYSPDVELWVASKLLLCAEAHKFKNLSHNHSAYYEAVLIAEKIKLKYSPAEILALKNFLITLSFLLKKYGDKKLVQKPVYPSQIDPHLFVNRYLPLIDDLLILVSSVENIDNEYAQESSEEREQSCEETSHKSHPFFRKVYPMRKC